MSVASATPVRHQKKNWPCMICWKLSSNLHFRNDSKTPILAKSEMRNFSVLFELAATKCFQSRQRIGSNSLPKFMVSSPDTEVLIEGKQISSLVRSGYLKFS